MFLWCDLNPFGHPETTQRAGGHGAADLFSGVNFHEASSVKNGKFSLHFKLIKMEIISREIKKQAEMKENNCNFFETFTTFFRNAFSFGRKGICAVCCRFGCTVPFVITIVCPY